MGESVGESVYTIDYYRKKYDEEMEWIRKVILTNGNLNRVMEDNINILLKDNKELRDVLEAQTENIQRLNDKSVDLIKRGADLIKENLDLKKDLKKELELCEECNELEESKKLREKKKE